jgi:hypothetical protein
MRITLHGFATGLGWPESDWRDEALRTNLWLIPAIESVAAVALFALTVRIDQAASHGGLRLPSWVISRHSWRSTPRSRVRSRTGPWRSAALLAGRPGRAARHANEP